MSDFGTVTLTYGSLSSTVADAISTTFVSLVTLISLATIFLAVMLVIVPVTVLFVESVVSTLTLSPKTVTFTSYSPFAEVFAFPATVI